MAQDSGRPSSDEAELEAVLADLHASACSAVDPATIQDLVEVARDTGVSSRRIEDEIGLLVRFRYRVAGRHET